MDKIIDTNKLNKAIESLGEVGRTAILANSIIANSPGIQSLIIGAIESNQLLEEIALIARLSTSEIREFYQSHSYSLEFIKMAIQAGAKLNKKSIEQTIVKKYL